MTKQEAQQLWQYQVQLRRIAASREAGVEDQIRKEFQRVLQQIQQILSRYYIAFGSNENATMSAGDLRAAGQYQSFLQDVLSGLDGVSEPIDQEIRTAIEDAYTVTYNGMVRGVRQASEGTMTLRDALGGLIATTPETVQHIVEHPMDKLKLSTILQRRRSQIVSHTKKTLAVGLANGDSYTKMASRIAQSLDGDYKKAMRIVRTEAHRAITRGFEDVAERTAELTDGSDYLYVKTWRSRGDQKVRDTHRDLNGVTILVKDAFESNGKKAPCPCQFGDPSEDINCRCRLVYRFLTREEFLEQGGELPENSELTDGENSSTMKMGRTKGNATTQLPPDFSRYHVEDAPEDVLKIRSEICDTFGLAEKDVKLDGIRNASVLAPFVKQMKKIHEETGFRLPNITAIEMIDGDPLCIAGYKPMENRFYISSRYFNSEKALTDTLKDWASKGILPKQAKTIRYLAEHEAAHMRIPDRVLQTDEAKAIHMGFIRSKSYNENGYKITEFFADSLALYRMNPNIIDSMIVKAAIYLEKEGVI